ncbi:MAG: PEGA domain-containing protein [Bradymonadia bacterium]
MSRIPLIGWLLLVFMVGAPSSVLAQGAPQGAEEEVDPAFTQTLSEGQAAFKAGRFKEAAELFRQAFEIDPRGNLLFNVAICYEKAGDTIAAVKFYERFIAAVPNARNRPQVQQQIVALKASLADKYVEVQVTTAPKGAYVFIDSKSQGTIGATPTTLKLLPGSYTLIVEKPDYETVKVPLDVAEGQPQQLEYVLVNSQKVGSVRLRIPEKGASVMVDGKNIGVSPIKDPIRLPQGPHEISVLKPGLTPWKKNVNVFAGQNSVVTVTFREEDAFDPLGDAGSSGGGDKLWAYVTMGTGVAMIAGGVFTGLSAQSLHDDLTAKRENQELIAQSDIDLGNTLVTTTNILLIGGTLAAAGGAVWWYLSDDEVDPDGEILTGGFFASPDGTAVFHLKGTF